jgi:hypothetical protein
MPVTHGLPQTIAGVLAHGSEFGALEPLTVLVYVLGLVADGLADSKPVAARFSQLRHTANRIYSRMRLLGLNETTLSEQCSLASIHLFDDGEVPALTRDRVSKILMNRQDVPAESAARIVSQAELTVLAQVLKVAVQWLLGQEQNRDPVVWNVLADSDRAVTFTNLYQAYEETGKDTRVWSQYPVYSFTSEAFAHAFNQVHFGRKTHLPSTRPLVQFYNENARLRRKWILRPNRSFKYTNLIYRSHFEHVTCGTGSFSAISKTILTRNLDVMMEAITNPSLKMELVILKDEYLTDANILCDYEFLSAVDDLFLIWGYHNADVGWSEHPSYVKPYRQLLDRLIKDRLCRDVSETVDYLKSLRSHLSYSPKTLSRSTPQ